MTESSAASDAHDADNAASKRSTEKATGYFPVELATKLTGLMSVVTISVAISFNVGYFCGIDINLFTLFALSEHILFAIEALPFAFIFVVSFFFSFYYPGKVFFTKATSALSRIGVDRIYSIFGIRGKDAVVLNALMIYFLTFIPYFVYIIYYHYALRYTIFLFLIMPVLFFLILRKSNNKRYWFISIYLLAVLFALSLSFVTGFDIARSYTSADVEKLFHSIAMKDGDELEGRIIRSGEKGVLFFDITSKEIIFVKWDDIERIRSHFRRSIKLPDTMR